LACAIAFNTLGRMKVLPAFLALVCVVLVVALFMTKGRDNTRHENDVTTITTFSNQLFTTQTEVDIYRGNVMILSNRLDDCQTTALTLSNQLNTVNSNLTSAKEENSKLTGQFNQSKSENEVLRRNIETLTGYIVTLTNQIATVQARAQASLSEANDNYARLENRFRRDVAERLVTERKFNNLQALKAQMDYLKSNPEKEVSTQTIYAGLDVVVKSNLVYVISPN
jgi:chromosome segregation ATPase